MPEARDPLKKVRNILRISVGLGKEEIDYINAMWAKRGIVPSDSNKKDPIASRQVPLFDRQPIKPEPAPRPSRVTPTSEKPGEEHLDADEDYLNIDPKSL